MARSRVVTVAAFAAWTVLVWIGRVRNVVADEDLSGAGRAWRAALAVVFLLGAAAVVFTLVQAARRTATASDRRAVQASVYFLFAVTVAVWLVRGTGIALDPDHDVAFKVVHTVLAVVSIALALVARLAVRVPWSASGRKVGGDVEVDSSPS